MGSETSSGLVLFIAAILVAGLAAAAMTAVISRMSVELRARGQGLADAIGTDLAVVNDPDNVPYSAGSLTLYIKNTGSVTLVSEEMTVLVDGSHETFTAALLDGQSLWTTGVVGELTVSVTLAAGDHKAKIIHTPNIADDLEFRV